MSSNLIIRIKIGDITQLVECMLCKHEVIGSSPIISISDDITQLVEWWNHNPYATGSSPVIIISKRNMAQLVARLFWEQEVMCSNRIIPIKKIKFNSV